MRYLFLVITAVLLAGSCTTTTAEEPNIDEIRDRLNRNACRITREDLIFQMGELEYLNDSTYTEIPSGLLADSLLFCPVTGDPYTMLIDDGDRFINCPAGHGESEF